MNSLKIEQLQEQASAWERVCEALDNAAPGWALHDGTGEECAVAAIKRLATQPQAPQGAVPLTVADIVKTPGISGLKATPLLSKLKAAGFDVTLNQALAADHIAALIVMPTACGNADSQGAVTDAERYEFLRNSAQRYQGDGMHPIDGSVWVVKYSHPKGTIPVMKSAGMGVELDANVDAAIRAAAPETPEGKK